jgi:four helix bundle protein
MPDYRKLDVYQRARAFSDRIAVVTARLPRPLADKADQLRRAADSIHEAIAEGCGLGTDRQLLKYLRIALGSGNECEDHLDTLRARNYLRPEDLDLIDEARRICAMLAKFAMRVASDIARFESRPKTNRAESQKRAPSAEGRGPG